MNLVNKKNLPSLEVGQIGHQVFGGFQSRAAEEIDVHPQLFGNAMGKRRLPQAWRAVKENVPECLASPQGGINRDSQAGNYLPLPHHLVHSRGPKLRIVLLSGRLVG